MEESNKLLQENIVLKKECFHILWEHCVPYHPDTTEIPLQLHDIVEKKNTIGDYTIQKRLGSGTFANIHSCVVKHGSIAKHRYIVKQGTLGSLCHPASLDTQLAIKIIDKSKYIKFNHVKRLSNEIKALKLLKSTYITNIYDILHTKNNVYIVMDHGKDDLFKYIDGFPEGIEESVAKTICKNLVVAIQFCHSRGVFHRDIKPENILMDSETYHVVLCDFGLCKIIENTKTTRVSHEFLGSPGFFAPEIMDKELCPIEKIDIWSAGVVIIEMLVGHDAFVDIWMKPYENLEEIKSKTFITTVHENLTKIFELRSVSPSLRELLIYIFTENPYERPGVNELLDSIWLKDVPIPPLNEKSSRPFSRRGSPSISL